MATWLLDAYVPPRAWFDRQEEWAYAGTHGIGHITRVLVWCAQLAERLDLPLRREELFWAAGIHDVKRWSDGRDREHGNRAAEFALRELPALRPDVARTVDLELVADLCRGHVPRDEDWPRWSDELRVLKDADGLERVRIHDLDPRRLRFQHLSPAFEERAWQLMTTSRAAGDTADAVRATAIAMGLWV